jgi:hypothetical protein
VPDQTADALPPSLNPRGPGAGSGPATRHGGHAAPGGLSAAAAVVLLLVVTLGFAAGTAISGNAFGRVFEGAFVVVTLYVALRIRIGSLFVAMVAPPLVYAAGVALSAVLNSESPSITTTNVAADILLAMSEGAPYLVGASVTSVVICIIRAQLAKSRSRNR